MKSTGIVRRLDALGRIVLPIELRREFGLGNKDPIEIYVNGEYIIVTKDVPRCYLCGSTDDVLLFKNKKICRACIAESALK